MLPKDAEPSSSWRWLRGWAAAALQLIDLRLALVIGLVAFLIAVSVDSAGNPAEAADLRQGATQPIPVQAVSGGAGLGLADDAANGAADLQQLSTARRLRHGMMTSAIMTSNRLTEAHFFTDLPNLD